MVILSAKLIFLPIYVVQYTVLLDKNENVRHIESEEQFRFIMSIIEALEIPFTWDPNESFNVSDKIRLRKTLDQYNITILDDMAGEIKIFLERDCVATWHKPSFVLKEDLSQIDPKKRLYLEMRCNFNSVFEDQPVQ